MDPNSSLNGIETSYCAILSWKKYFILEGVITSLVKVFYIGYVLLKYGIYDIWDIWGKGKKIPKCQ